MLRSVIALIAGVIALTVVAALVSTGYDILAPAALSESGTAVHSTDPVRLGDFVGAVVIGLSGGFACGYVTATLAPRAPFVHVGIVVALFMAIILVMSVFVAVVSLAWTAYGLFRCGVFVVAIMLGARVASRRKRDASGGTAASALP